MLEINFEFRKGIFFMRIIGNLYNKNYYTDTWFDESKEADLYSQLKNPRPNIKP